MTTRVSRRRRTRASNRRTVAPPPPVPPADEAGAGPTNGATPQGRDPLGSGPAGSPTSDGTSPAQPALEATIAFPRALKIFGAVVAPTTLFTALAFYFGMLHVTGMFRYLGVNPTVLGLTTQDYLIRAVDGLFNPLIVAAAAVVLLALWTYRLITTSLSGGSRPRTLAVLAAVTGLVLLGLAVAGLLHHPLLFPEGGGLCLAIGVLLLSYASRLLWRLRVERRPDSTPRLPDSVVVADWGAVFLLVSIGLFWATGSYAIAVGTGRGQQIAAQLPSSSDVTVFSAKSLNLHVPGVTERTCQNAGSAYPFRYDGLKLVLQSGNQYLFLPTGWTPTQGSAVLIPRTDSVRLEFSAAGQTPAPTC